MTIACPACRVEVEETANYCSACGPSLISPGLARSEVVPEPEVETAKGNWFSRVFRVSKASRPGSWFNWSFDVEVTTSGASSLTTSSGDSSRGEDDLTSRVPPHGGTSDASR